MTNLEGIAKIAYNAKIAILAYQTPTGSELPLMWDDLPPEHFDRPWALATAKSELENGPADLHTIESFIKKHQGQENFTIDQAAFLMTVYSLRPFYTPDT